MECTRIKDLLSEYLDGMLDAQTEARVEEHLSTCQGCKEELAGLKALVKELSALESMEAPKDFLDQVHERMEPRFSLRKIIRTLFVPARIKIPLELATAGAMVVLVLTIFNVQQPKQRIVNGPGVSREFMVAGKPGSAPTRLTAPKGILKSEPGLEAVAVKPLERESAPIELALLLTPEVSDRAYTLSGAADVAPAPRKAEGETRVLMDAAPKAKMKMGALQEENHVPRLRPKEMAALEDETKPPLSYVDQTLSKVKNVVELAGGKVVSTQGAKDSGQPLSIRAEIPAEHYNSFCEALRKLGNLSSAHPSLPETDQEVLQVHVRLVSK
ncbi:MAG: zf-HC2 domain-containing protein [Deltaproteobacteria bacterium]|jgi:hypothetical protein